MQQRRRPVVVYPLRVRGGEKRRFPPAAACGSNGALYAAEDLLELKAVAKGAETGGSTSTYIRPTIAEASTVELNKLRVSVKRTGEEQLYGFKVCRFGWLLAVAWR